MKTLQLTTLKGMTAATTQTAEREEMNRTSRHRSAGGSPVTDAAAPDPQPTMAAKSTSERNTTFIFSQATYRKV